MRHLIAAFLLTLCAASMAQPGEHTLNLKDADIRVFVATVSEITGKSFIVDPRVEGKVNVISTRPMGAEEVYQTFESVLRVHGFAAIPSGKMVKIVPEVVAKQDGDANAVPSGGPDALLTKVIELKYVSASELVPVLTQLVPQTGQVSPLGGANALVITDRAGNLARIESIIRRIDQATDAAIDVIPLRHASAEALARTLTLLNEEKVGAAINGSQPTRVFADARTNSILLSGDRAARLRMRTMIGHLDTPLENSDSTNVIYVRYAKSADLVEILTQTADTLTRQNGDEKGAKAATIQAHAETNALVITADPTVFRALASVVRQLDVRRAQVMIEGVIAELSDETANELGVQLGAPVNGLDDNTFLGGSNFPGTGSGNSITGFATNPLGVGAGLTLGYITGQSTITGPDSKPLNILNVAGLVRALKGSGKNNILSTPTLVTLDNHEAELSVGQEVPFIQGEFTTNVANAAESTAAQGIAGNPFRTIQRKEVGLKLTVTPHINEGDTVLLDINQEVSSLAPTSSAASDLITNKRTLSTSVMVPDRKMLVLGGLLSTEVRENVSKVPGLGDIPILGNLFRYRSSNSTQRNLMLFLKPTILIDAATEASVTSEKYNFIRAAQQRARVQQENLVPKEVHPVLPEMPLPQVDAEQKPQ